MSKEPLKKREKAEDCIHIRFTSQEKDFLREKVKERGVSISLYVKQKLFSEEQQNLYNVETANLLYKITDILVNQVKQYCNDEKFIDDCERTANELWQCLK